MNIIGNIGTVVTLMGVSLLICSYSPPKETTTKKMTTKVRLNGGEWIELPKGGTIEFVDKEVCPECKGTGFIIDPPAEVLTAIHTKIPCPKCGGLKGKE